MEGFEKSMALQVDAKLSGLFGAPPRWPRIQSQFSEHFVNDQDNGVAQAG